MKNFAKNARIKSVSSLLATGLCALSFSCHSPAATDEPSVIPIYVDGFSAGVSDWSWTNTDPASTGQVFEGSYSLFGEQDSWEGIYLTMRSEFSLPADGNLNFSIYSESDTVIVIQTSSINTGDGKPIRINVAANQWQQQSISLTELGAGDQLTGIWWQQYTPQPSGGVYLDNVHIAGAISPPEDTPGAFRSPESTSRFLSRATFGATAGEIDRLSGSSASQWFRTEVGKPPSRYLDAVRAELQQPGATDPSGEPTFQGRTTPNFVFWQHAISAPDQLRQRMVYALSQLLVISNAQSALLFDRPTSVAAYQDILSRNALGNYRDLLEEVTYSTAMGEYLTYMQNRKGNSESGRLPDENYARELMQLFTIGLVELDMDGRPRTRNGESIETYSNRDVSGLARVFTGMSYALEGFEPGFVLISSAALASPMVFFPEHHETGQKQFLGTTIPAGTSGEASISMALDALIMHPNTPPFIARQLIQRFTTSHPSAGYIRRVATAFAQGTFTLPDGSTVGEGRRGDLTATIAAILFDDDALAEPGANPQSGKLREPVLRFTHWARAFDAKALTVRHLSGLWNTGDSDALSQSPFRSPSVFNFYRPGYVAPGTETGEAGLTVPELQLVSASSVPGYINFMRGFVFADAQSNSDPDIASSFAPDYSNEVAFADTPDALVGRLNRVLAAGRLRPATVERIAAFIKTLPQGDAQQGDARLRVMHAVLMVMTSPEYTVQY